MELSDIVRQDALNAVGRIKQKLAITQDTVFQLDDDDAVKGGVLQTTIEIWRELKMVDKALGVTK